MIRFIWPICTAMLLLCACADRMQPTSVDGLHLQPIDAAGLEAAILAHRGKVVLVDFWATWCGPCVELLPHTLELQHRFDSRQLAVITVSLDDPDQAANARRTLAENHAVGEHFISTYGVGPAAFEAFAIDDGAIPHLRLYDREGRLVKTFGGGRKITPQAIEQTIQASL